MTTFLNPTFIISILIALSVHEWAHGMMAYRLGDHTAKEQGRLTLNPIAHLDLLGTILFLTVGFGWGKPVPINERNFRHPRILITGLFHRFRIRSPGRTLGRIAVATFFGAAAREFTFHQSRPHGVQSSAHCTAGWIQSIGILHSVPI